MKLLKTLIKPPKYTHNQVLSWLLWIRGHCSNLPCGYCEYCRIDSGGLCAITDTYKDIVTTEIKSPNRWRLIRKNLTPERPESFEFLRHLHWSKQGNPVPPPKGCNSETTNQSNK